MLELGPSAYIQLILDIMLTGPVRTSLKSSNNERRIEKDLDRLICFGKRNYSAQYYLDYLFSGHDAETPLEINNETTSLIRRHIPDYKYGDEVFYFMPKFHTGHNERIADISPHDLKLHATIQFLNAEGEANFSHLYDDWVMKAMYGKNYYYVGCSLAGQGLYLPIPENTTRIECTLQIMVERLKRRASHTLSLNLERVRGNTLFTPYHSESNYDVHSFTTLQTVTGAAESEEDIRSIPRVKDQVVSLVGIDDDPDWIQIIEIEEEIDIKSTSISRF